MMNDIKCTLCGQKWKVAPGDFEALMMQHMVVAHPLQLLQNTKVQRTITQFFESIGANLADRLKGEK